MRGLLLLTAVVILGCAPAVTLTKINPMSESLQRGDIDVFTSAASIKRDYTEVALISVDDGGWGRSDKELLEALISKARTAGADGLIILGFSQVPDGGLWAALVYSNFTRTIVRGSAIVYTKDGDKHK